MRRRALDAAGAVRPARQATTLPAGTAGVDVYAGFWRRVAAEVLDYLALFVPNMIVLAFVGEPDSSTIGSLLWIAYKISLEAQGATLGKRAVRIRVVDPA